MLDDDEMTTPRAAAYLNMSRQALTIAAERGEIGRKAPVIGRKPPYVWVFTKLELDIWVKREKSKGGRPKRTTAVPAPVIAV